MVPLLSSIKLTNLLSFGPDSPEIPLGPLNILIGPNGSGKSNLLEAIDLLRNAPNEISKPIRQGGGIQDWLWKGSDTETASIDLNIKVPAGDTRAQYWGISPLRYSVSFCEMPKYISTIKKESIIAEQIAPSGDKVIYERTLGKVAVLNIDGVEKQLNSVSLENSILAQIKNPESYDEITWLAENFAKIQLYREWSFGRYMPARMPQRADLPNKYLEPDASNLGLVLNYLSRYPEVKKRLLDALKALYDGIDDFHINIEGNTVQVFFHEKNMSRPIPATRLSDGTLRYLCLLAILCHPEPPPLVCIEEPELGLHPDVLPTLADLLREASERCQLIVTTHSDMLIDAFTDTSEVILVMEKDANTGSSVCKRLSSEELKPWLENYSLGEFWIRGGIGGKRW